ncbi:hypothetical protein I6A84_11410 [Frankia sp. CNm7]|uniref:Uncharacterized protein n=1 Tax=Frankia nepalensis TaxID=1836974 RepID=A0A937RRE3_9ACTN|nr:hypothetical protein [Frankia nepalensis]MBL7514834.1 hypothetical protein [Frankia nepalensis]MBL7518704.1 hypothetical protein [Frankia nepalensis]MBL7633565.1 hypothetical protein [Frankia nepalensis]
MVVSVVALLLAGLAAWGIGALRPGANRPSAEGTAPAGSGPATAPAGGGGTAGAVPPAMLGGWRGTVSQGGDIWIATASMPPVQVDIPPVQFDVTLDIRGGAVHEVIGTSTSSTGCAADLILKVVGIRQIEVQEVDTHRTERCMGAYRLRLTLNDDGTLDYTYDATWVSSRGIATLRRTP